MPVSVLVATQTFWTTVNGQPFLVSVGQRFYSDHPAVVANASLFAAAPLVDVPNPS